jgi:fructose-1-phosphate kinase PfkB-like protein
MRAARYDVSAAGKGILLARFVRRLNSSAMALGRVGFATFAAKINVDGGRCNEEW